MTKHPGAGSVVGMRKSNTTLTSLYGHLLNKRDPLACMENAANIYFQRKIYNNDEELLAVANRFRKQKGKKTNTHETVNFKNVLIDGNHYIRDPIYTYIPTR